MVTSTTTGWYYHRWGCTSCGRAGSTSRRLSLPAEQPGQRHRRWQRSTGRKGEKEKEKEEKEIYRVRRGRGKQQQQQQQQQPSPRRYDLDGVSGRGLGRVNDDGGDDSSIGTCRSLLSHAARGWHHRRSPRTPRLPLYRPQSPSAEEVKWRRAAATGRSIFLVLAGRRALASATARACRRRTTTFSRRLRRRRMRSCDHPSRRRRTHPFRPMASSSGGGVEERREQRQWQWQERRRARARARAGSEVSWRGHGGGCGP